MNRALRFGVGGLVLLLALVCALAVSAARDARALNARVSKSHAQLRYVYALQLATLTYVSAPEGAPGGLDAIEGALAELEKASEDELEAVDEDEREAEEAEGEYAAVLSHALAQSPPPTAAVWPGVLEALEAWHADELGEVHGAEAVAQAASNRAMLLAGVAGLIGLLWGGYFALIWLPRLLSRLRRITVTMARVGEGDVRARVDDVVEDEIGVLARAFDAAADQRDRLMVDRTELEDAVRLAREADTAKSRFLANMSHEIRTPMNAVMGMLELALSMCKPGELRECLVIARDGSHTLLDVINDILDFSRIEAGRLEIVEQDLDLEALTSSVVRTLSPLAHQKGLELVRALDPRTPRCVKGDPARIRQILVNLLGNAIKFTDRGEVALRIHPDETAPQAPRLLFEVKDTGRGICEADLAAIFDAFQQVADGRAATTGGTGLGLSISRRLAQAMHGDIHAESLVGVGSRFVVSLPLRPGADVEASSLEAAAAALAGLTVLAVDDNPTNLEIVEAMTRGWGMEPVTSQQGAGAVERIERLEGEGRSCALLLLDWVMGDVGGLEVVREVRADPDLRGLPIVVLTSGGAPLDELSEAGLEVQGCLRKPVDERSLLSAIATALQVVAPRSTAPSSSATELTDLDGLRVLVAEDNPINQVLARKLLERAGADVTIAVDGGQAVERYGAGTFDVVLMDLQMPTMNGFEATAGIRRLGDGRGQRTPILAVTAYAMESDRQRCLDSGMDGFISKPISVPELLHAIQRLGKGVEPEDLQESLEEISNADLRRELLAIFVEELPEQIIEIRAQIEARDVTGLGRSVHALKGATLALGTDADLLSSTAMLLEQRLRAETSGEVTWALAQDLLQQLESFETRVPTHV